MRDDALSVIVCGSSAAMATPAYLKWMRQEIDVTLRVLLTRSAQRFMPTQVVGWHVEEVYASDDPALNPTEFAKRSMAVVVLPATADMLAAAALGLASTPAQTVLLASDRPALFFPSMNRTMWEKRSTQRHVATLRGDGHVVVEPRIEPIFELWQQENAMGPALRPPNEATEIVIAWLESGAPAESGQQDPSVVLAD